MAKLRVLLAAPEVCATLTETVLDFVVPVQVLLRLGVVASELFGATPLAAFGLLVIVLVGTEDRFDVVDECGDHRTKFLTPLGTNKRGTHSSGWKGNYSVPNPSQKPL
ncbi:hypothetical protein, partial [Halococcus salsus]|uniref:hypothetical protein n=1 Tax=Halococcus salsus TaxID=2162894 RepID=UPI0019653BA8